MSAETLQPLFDLEHPDIPAQEYSMVFVGGGGGTAKMIEGAINVLEPKGMLLPPNYEQDLAVPLVGGIRLTAGTGGADGGSFNGLSRRALDDLAMGDANNILAHSVADTTTRRILRERFVDGDREAALYNRGMALADVALRRGVAMGRIEEVIEHTVRLSTKVMESVRQDGGRDDMYGHRLGTMVLHALNEMHNGNAAKATRELGRWVGARADVLITTHTPHEIYLKDGYRTDGKPHIEYGEERIDGYSPRSPLKAIIGTQALVPGKAVEISDELWTALTQSDVIIDAPGSPFASGWAARAPEGYADASAVQQQRGGKLIGVSNLVEETKSRLGLTAAQQGEIAVKSGGGRAYDAYIYNEVTAGLKDPIIPYAKSAEEEFSPIAAEHIAADLVDRTFQVEAEAGDPIASRRSQAAHSVPRLMSELNQRNAFPFQLVS